MKAQEIGPGEHPREAYTELKLGTGRPALSIEAQEIGPGESPREAHMGKHISSPLNCTPGPNLQTASMDTQAKPETQGAHWLTHA